MGTTTNIFYKNLLKPNYLEYEYLLRLKKK